MNGIVIYLALKLALDVNDMIGKEMMNTTKSKSELDIEKLRMKIKIGWGALTSAMNDKAVEQAEIDYIFEDLLDFIEGE